MAATLTAKLKIKEGQKVLVMNAPQGFFEKLAPLPPNTEIEHEPGNKKLVFDLVLLFVLNRKELEFFGDAAIASLKKDGILWFGYPKLSSGIKSDLTRDEGWAYLNPYALAGVASIAIDEIWTGLRFKHSAGGVTHQEQMAAYKNRDKSPESKVIVVPDDFQVALNKNPEAQKVFEKFAYTHRKEYVRWIESAKKQETRDGRIVKAIAMLEEGVKIS
jgi:hypothetical protein